MNKKFEQGYYVPVNKDKYVGDVTNIRYLSSWELKMFVYLDRNPNVIKWGSEELVLQYFSPVDNKIHRYITDMIAWIRTKDGSIKKYVLEVKPEKQTRPPKKPKRQTKNYINEVKTYIINQAKWKAATEWCSNNGFQFQIITEKTLNI